MRSALASFNCTLFCKRAEQSASLSKPVQRRYLGGAPFCSIAPLRGRERAEALARKSCCSQVHLLALHCGGGWVFFVPPFCFPCSSWLCKYVGEQGPFAVRGEVLGPWVHGLGL